MSLPKLKQRSWTEGLLTFGVLTREICSEIQQSEMLNLSFSLSGYKITPHRLLNFKVIALYNFRTEFDEFIKNNNDVQYYRTANVLVLDFINCSSRINNL
ncbi:hypothetical protein WUBG_00743 [Wuchereria bancrofti]|uniref:Uncharacterized protein n=1 Tax=Wuchereria bancrofti TaxID=6293 RepID=J9F0E4_WUCBA|nr:hypothetical protein WUBG_00743 [Wuchereria bancrofti]